MRQVSVSTDSGRHFTRDNAMPADGTVGSTSGWLWAVDHAGRSAHLTDDGRTWMTIPLPPARQLTSHR